jgi:hypothetical protein
LSQLAVVVVVVVVSKVRIFHHRTVRRDIQQAALVEKGKVGIHQEIGVLFKGLG